MLLVAIAVVLAVVIGLLAGGRLGRLAEQPWYGLGWLVAGVVLQILGWLLSGLAGMLYPICLLLSALCVGVFLLGNLRSPGVALLALGFLCNAVVVLLNGAMPVSLNALSRAGLTADPSRIDADPRHELSGDGTLLPWLGDAIPLALPGIGQAISPGDLLIAAGTGLILYAGMTHHAPATRSTTGRHSVDATTSPMSVRLTEDDNRRIRRYAQRHGYDLNEAIHRIIATGTYDDPAR